MWGLKWKSNIKNSKGLFPQYYKNEGGKYIAISEPKVLSETKLRQQKFRLAKPGQPYISPSKGAWATPGPKAGPFKVKLTDGSVVTYYWYRFIDQPAFWQYTRRGDPNAWSAEKKAKLQALVEKMHTAWPIDRDYMAPPAFGRLVKLDPALLVTPPPGLEVGYVPIVVHQEVAQK